jgi:hypothetical protein
MAINDNITVVAGKITKPAIDVETTTTIEHASTGNVYASEAEAQADIDNPETSTKTEDIKRDVAITVNKLPDILGGSS